VSTKPGAGQNEEILASLRRSVGYATIKLVGPRAIEAITDFDVVVDASPEQKLASMLATGVVDGIVRGTVDDKKTIQAYKALTGESDDRCPALLQDPVGRQFFLCAASNTDGWTKQQRLAEACATAAFMKGWGIEPKIAVFTAIRHETNKAIRWKLDRVSRALKRTYRDAQWIVKKLRALGYTAENMTIDLNSAVDDGYNIHVPINGIVGNQIFRTFVFCGGKVVTATRIGLKQPYEDNSRSEKDFESHVRWLVALINKKRGSQN
jgi:predicted methyltransferase MtxX (methanogen marker protein 4)